MRRAFVIAVALSASGCGSALGRWCELTHRCSARSQQSLRLDGTGCLQLPDSADWDLGSEWTLEAWTKMERPLPLADQEYVVIRTTGPSGPAPFFLDMANSLVYGGERLPSGSWLSPSAPLTDIAPTWHHAAVTFSEQANEVDFVLDGQRTDFNTIDGPVVPSAGHLWIGCDADASRWVGEIDDLRIWKRARSIPEIAAGRGSQLTDVDPDLVANWQFEGDGDVLYDSARGHDAQRVPGVSFSTDVHE